MHKTTAFIAATRFGLGARPGDLANIGSDPRGWLLDQLGPTAPPSGLSNLPPAGNLVAEMASMRRAKSEEEKRATARARQDRFQEEMRARVTVQAGSDQPFRERLVAYWSNHFTVSITRKEVLSLAGAFERQVIRPRITGRFDNLLLASSQHPAMLGYLDQFRSIGPHSRAGQRSGRGLNENLAREILELHTLGVNGGYAQSDVESLAKLLTGWGLETSDGEFGAFSYNENRHEPGRHQLVGTTYGGHGLRDGIDALRDLARHPSTAKNVATRMVRHFVADTPPPSAVAKVERAFRDSEGDLAEVARALVACPEAWTQPLAKVKSPWDLVISTARGFDYVGEADAMLDSMRWLGQVPFQAPSPQGWPDTAEGWIGPESMLSRIEWAESVGREAAGRVADVPALAEELVGPVLDRSTRRALAAAPPPDAIALLLASPAFQRR
jgi:uncharacterized protein (DUF1800 family)